MQLLQSVVVLLLERGILLDDFVFIPESTEGYSSQPQKTWRTNARELKFEMFLQTAVQLISEFGFAPNSEVDLSQQYP